MVLYACFNIDYRNYIECLVDLPWSKSTADTLDIEKARYNRYSNSALMHTCICLCACIKCIHIRTIAICDQIWGNIHVISHIQRFMELRNSELNIYWFI